MATTRADTTSQSAALDVETPVGVGRLHRFPSSTTARAVLALGHGAGGGIGARDLQAIAQALPATGVEVVLVEQPWVVSGKRIAPAPTRLDAAWLPLVAELDRPRVPLIVGGRSAGARVACRTAQQSGAIGVVALAFPLHSPGKPEPSRIDELSSVGVPVSVIQGTRDPFGTAAEVTSAIARKRGISVTAIAGADHGFKVAANSESTTNEALDEVVHAIERECTRMLGR